MSLLLILPILLISQNKASFEAYSDSKEVILNGYFDVTFALKNANGTDFIPPDFKDFIVLAGPNTSTSMQIINGQVSREIAYSFTLQAKKAGTFQIGSASIKANGKKLTTAPFPVKVIRGSQPASGTLPEEKEVYIALEPSQKEAFLGEQILLDFKLYTTVSLDGYDIIEEPDYRGFFTQELKRFNFRTQREVINGRQVTTKVLRRLALFPQQTGALIISPARIQLAVVEESDKKGFFFNRSIRPVFITTDSVIIDVQALPGSEPAYFTDAVGRFDFQSSVNRNQSTTDDAVSVMMLIQGNGDIKRVQPPPLVLSDSFEIYPPKIIEEESTEERGELYGKKVLEYLILPKYPGQYTIRPAFTYFNTEAGVFDTLTTGPYSLSVEQGMARRPPETSSDVTQPVQKDIRFIKTGDALEEKGISFLRSPVFWAFLTLPPIAFLAMLIIRRRREKSIVTDAVLLKRLHAKSDAEKRLALARSYLSSADGRYFYDEIAKASFGYASDKLNIPLSELSKHNVKDRLKSLQVSEPLIEDLMQILNTCEKAVFAGLDNVADMQQVYDKTVTVISGMEEEIG